jgi:hypothetical protein
MDNAERSNRFGISIWSLHAEYGDEPETAVIDLLADAMHWADASGHDFHYLLAVAGMHYIHELNDQQTDERRMS